MSKDWVSINDVIEKYEEAELAKIDDRIVLWKFEKQIGMPPLRTLRGRGQKPKSKKVEE